MSLVIRLPAINRTIRLATYVAGVSLANDKAETPASGDREEPKKLDPEKGDFFLKVKKMLRHYAKHAPKKDETSEFVGGAFA